MDVHALCMTAPMPNVRSQGTATLQVHGTTYQHALTTQEALHVDRIITMQHWPGRNVGERDVHAGADPCEQ